MSMWPILLAGTALPASAIYALVASGAERQRAWQGFAAVAILIVSMVLTHLVSFDAGQADVRVSTVVVAGEPFYRGAYMGRCLRDGPREFCATEADRAQVGEEAAR